MKIRSEQPNDIVQIKNVYLIAFETDTEANLVDALRNAGVKLISLVAEKNGEIIGHILFSPVTLDQHTKIIGLSPMAVLPNWQRKGVGSKLINQGMKPPSASAQGILSLSQDGGTCRSNGGSLQSQVRTKDRVGS